VSTRSRALQNVVWSTAVQFGPSTPVIESALAPLLLTTPINLLTDEAIIRAIYAERGRTNSAGVPVHFIHAAPSAQKNVLIRFKHELADALAELADENGP
jgi:hypothetical protein